MASILLVSVNMPVFYEKRGVKLLTISLITTLTRCIELILKPYIGFLSDNSNLKFGRRKPFMIFGSLFYAIFLVLLFSPPSNKIISIWFSIFYILFHIADTICCIPYLGLGPELSINSEEREKLYLILYFFEFIGVLATSILPIIMGKLTKQKNCKILCNNEAGEFNVQSCIQNCENSAEEELNQSSYIFSTMGISYIFLISMIFLILSFKEKNNKRKKNKKSYIVPTLWRMMKNKPFINLLIPYIIDYSIAQIFATMLPLFIIYIIQPREICIEKNILITNSECNSDTYLGYTLFSLFLSCLLFLFIWHFLIKKFGKIGCWTLYSLICVIVFCFLFIIGKGNTTLIIISGVLVAIPASGCYLNDSILSDTIDYDELLTRKRNEGIYVIVQAFVPKLVGILAQGIPLAFLSCK